MLSSITPLGERGRGNRWGSTAGAYIAGSTLGGSVLGAGLGWVGSLLPRAPRVALGALALAALASVIVELRLGGARFPTNHRQVDERWLDAYRGPVYGFGFGLQLGMGILTIVTSATTYLTMLAAVAAHSIVGGVAIVGTFGLVRALPVLLAVRVVHPAGLRDLHARTDRWGPAARRITVGGQLCALVVAVLAMMVV